MGTDHIPADQRFHLCPDCKCQFVQPFVCTTCGAQKLYDETVRSQAATIEHLRADIELLKQSGAYVRTGKHGDRQVVIERDV